MPENFNVKELHGVFYVYHEDENQKYLTFKIKQRIVFNIYKQRIDKNNNHEIYDDINIEEVCLTIDFSRITNLFLIDLKNIDENGDVEITKDLFKTFDMEVFLSTELNNEKNKSFYKVLETEWPSVYSRSVYLSNSRYVKDNNESLFEDPVKDLVKSQKKIKIVYTISGIIMILAIIFLREQFFVYCMYFLIPMYYLLSKKTILKIFILGAIYKAISNFDITTKYIGLFGAETENYFLPDFTILLISFLITNFLTNHSYFSMKMMKNIKSLYFIFMQYKVINHNIWIIKNNFLDIKSKLLLYVKDFCDKNKKCKDDKKDKEEFVIIEKLKS